MTKDLAQFRILVFIFRGHFASFQDQDYPAHITALLRTDLIQMCQETGFSEPYFYSLRLGGQEPRKNYPAMKQIPAGGNDLRWTWTPQNFRPMPGRARRHAPPLRSARRRGRNSVARTSRHSTLPTLS